MENDPIQEIRISVNPEYRSRVRAQLLFYRKQSRSGRHFIALLFFSYSLLQLALIVFGLFSVNAYDTFLYTFSGMGFLFPLLLLLIAAELWFHLLLRGRIWFAMRQPHLVKHYYLPIDFKFSQDAVEFRTDMDESVNMWEAFHSYFENKHLLLLTIKNGGFWSIPKDQIKSRAKLIDLRTLLNKKIGEQESNIVYVDHYQNRGKG